MQGRLRYRTGHYFIWSESRQMSDAQSLLVKYEWNPVWQEKWRLSLGDTEQCAYVPHRLWSYTLQRTCIPLCHGRKSAPYSTNELQFWQGSDRPQALWGSGNTEVQGSSRALTASAKPKDAPVKATWFSPPHTRCQQSEPALFKHVVCKAGFKGWCVFHHNSSDPEGQEGLIQTG